MKKVFLMAAAAALLLGSCSKNDGNGHEIEAGKTHVVIKLEGVKAAGTRATEVAGTTGKLKLNDGHIFVIDATDAVFYDEELNVTLALDEGQTLTENGNPKLVPSDARVYILGNVPTDVDVDALNDWEDIEEAISDIANNEDYTDAFLANNDGEPAGIDIVADGKGEVEIQLSPLYTRMELHQIVGGDNIVDFKVAGVYVDEYYSAFTATGAPSGDMWFQAQSKDFSTNPAVVDPTAANVGVADVTEGPWGSFPYSITNDPTAKPGAGASEVWAYHMAAGSLPRFIIHFSEINFLAEDPANLGTFQPKKVEDRYITVTGYQEETTEELTAFLRGKIYRIGEEAGITFELDDLGTTPNPKDVELLVKVGIDDWDLEGLTPIL